MEKRVIVSTVGTSILTNYIPKEEKTWYSKLRDSANIKVKEETPLETQIIIESLKNFALANLEEENLENIKRFSAELNGILSFYKGNIHQGSNDIHYLIGTDTYQGKVTVQIVKKFLLSKGIKTVIEFIPNQLSTANTASFSSGIKELIKWCDENLEVYKEQCYKIFFNLVGSFKSLQGYMNTIGMFYADEIFYIFESPTADLIRIPRLPIQLDNQVFKDYAQDFILMAQGEIFPITSFKEKNIPESLLDDDGENVLLSNWGLLSWNKVKSDILSRDTLLELPYLEYCDPFKKGFKNLSKQEKIKLQECLAKVSHLIKANKGDFSSLCRDGGLQYEKYKNHPGIDHFRVTQGIRISCNIEGEKVILRKYGKEEDINKNP